MKEYYVGAKDYAITTRRKCTIMSKCPYALRTQQKARNTHWISDHYSAPLSLLFISLPMIDVGVNTVVVMVTVLMVTVLRVRMMRLR